jgi:hypothetical protein
MQKTAKREEVVCENGDSVFSFSPSLPLTFLNYFSLLVAVLLTSSIPTSSSCIFSFSSPYFSSSSHLHLPLPRLIFFLVSSSSSSPATHTNEGICWNAYPRDDARGEHITHNPHHLRRHVAVVVSIHVLGLVSKQSLKCIHLLVDLCSNLHQPKTKF